MNRPPPTPHTMLQALEHFAEQARMMRATLHASPHLLLTDDGGAVRTSLEKIPTLRADMNWLVTNPASPLTDAQRDRATEPTIGPLSLLDEIGRSLEDDLSEQGRWSLHWSRMAILTHLEMIDELPMAWQEVLQFPNVNFVVV